MEVDTLPKIADVAETDNHIGFFIVHGVVDTAHATLDI